jgi:methyl-accepting chemotaxis protein|tara:strand:- start:3 stop:590 length:588 start_codon:yes stop_codon:yes gene_type:complete
MKPSERPHYVNNALFSQSVVDHVLSVREAEAAGEKIPQMPRYVAECFLKISEGLSHKSNFVRYTYREEMVMDAVENCLRACKNYNIEAATRKGKPNAFGYFTQIAWYAFLRRIKKEQRQQDVKLNYLAESGLEEFMVDPNEDPQVAKAVQSFVDNLRRRIDDVKDNDTKIKDYKKKMVTKRTVRVDSDLSAFFEE